MTKRIKYFTYYGCSDPKCQRQNSPAADTKIDYVVNALNRAGYDVDIISFTPVTCKAGFVKGVRIISGRNAVKYFPCFGRGASIVGKLYNRILYKSTLFLWGLLNLHKCEKIIVYHSLHSDAIFLKLAKLLHLRIVGEIEEIYQDVHPQTKAVSKREYDFIKGCIAYIFPNTVLNERLNPTNKPYLVIHGIYQLADNEKKKIGDKIDILYSGTFDPVKGGANSAIDMATYLSDSYRLHITGFGTAEELAAVSEKVVLAKQTSKAEILFHGFLDNEAYKDLLRRCVIGLCSQDPRTPLNLTSFPSKILQYMANGVIVVSGKNKAIEDSRVSSCLYLYEEHTPQKIAECVMSISEFDTSKQDDLLKSLDEELPNELQILLNS